MEGLIYEGKFAFQKFTVFVLFCFVFEGNFPSKSPRGAYIWGGGGGDLTEGFLRSRFAGIHGGAYFRNFTVFPQARPSVVNLFLNDSSLSAFCRLLQ